MVDVDFTFHSFWRFDNVVRNFIDKIIKKSRRTGQVSKTSKMIKKVIIIIILAIIAGGFAFYLFHRSEEEPFEMVKKGNMKIESPAFENNQSIPSKYTCDGENVSPPFKISQVPKETKSLVLISDDPDAPARTWVHWTVWNIDPKTEEIAEASVPREAVEGATSFGKPGYGGPCPPSGTHRYFFKLYALDTVLNLDSSAEAGDIEEAMKDHVLDSAELLGLYKRK